MTRYDFWRPSIFALAAGAIIVLLCNYLLSTPLGPIRKGGIVAELALPHPMHRPEDVVRFQIEALKNQSKGVGALQCYCFAAPANRSVTGPLTRFAELVRRPPYEILGESKSYSIGNVQLSGNRAHCLVVVVGRNQQVRVFSWGLRKHSEPPFESCWLTVGVIARYDSMHPLQSVQLDLKKRALCKYLGV